MATLAVQNLVKSGSLDIAYAAADVAGDEMPNDGRTLLHIKNGGAGSITATVAAQLASKDFGGSYGVFTRANIAAVIPAGEDAIIGPLPPSAWNNVNGRAAITYTGVTSVTVAALRVPLA